MLHCKSKKVEIREPIKNGKIWEGGSLRETDVIIPELMARHRKKSRA